MRRLPPTAQPSKGGFAYGAVHKRRIATVCVAKQHPWQTAIHLQHKQRYTQFAHPAVAQALPQPSSCWRSSNHQSTANPTASILLYSPLDPHPQDKQTACTAIAAVAATVSHHLSVGAMKAMGWMIVHTHTKQTVQVVAQLQRPATSTGMKAGYTKKMHKP